MNKVRTKKTETHNGDGFTLAELVIAAAILIVTITGILMSYIRCIELNEISKNSSLATQAAMGRMEQIKGTAFANIYANYNNVPFGVAGFNGMGVSYVDDTNPNMLVVTVSVAWQLSNGRVFGEDNDLDGQIDIGEDINGNAMLDSPVLLVNNIYNR